MAGQSNNYRKRSHLQSDSAANGGSKRRNPGEDSEQQQLGIGSRRYCVSYLCPLKKIGSVIGRGGEIITQMRADTKANIILGMAVMNHCRILNLFIPHSREVDRGDYWCNLLVL